MGCRAVSTTSHGLWMLLLWVLTINGDLGLQLNGRAGAHSMTSIHYLLVSKNKPFTPRQWCLLGGDPLIFQSKSKSLNTPGTFDFRVVEEGFRFTRFQVRFPPKLNKYRSWFCNVDILILWSFEDNGKL